MDPHIKPWPNSPRPGASSISGGSSLWCLSMLCCPRARSFRRSGSYSAARGLSGGRRTRGIDALTGTATTGHDWDGIKELNTPLPRWWLWLFYITIVWAIGYWMTYPAWPLLTKGQPTGYLRLERAQRRDTDLNEFTQLRGPMMTRACRRFACRDRGPSAALRISHARSGVRLSPIIVCPVMAPGAARARGIPTLTPTTGFGAARSPIRGHHPPWRPVERRQRPPGLHAALRRCAERDRYFGRSRTTWVRCQGSRSTKAPISARDKNFQPIIVRSVMGPKAREITVGLGQLADKVWLYGIGQGDDRARIQNGHGGVMPAWASRLPDPTIKALAVFVHSLGGGEK